MKTLLLSLTLLSCVSLSAYENNAYVFLYESHEGTQLNACIIHEGHYYYAPKVEHYEQCPCLSEY